MSSCCETNCLLFLSALSVGTHSQHSSCNRRCLCANNPPTKNAISRLVILVLRFFFSLLENINFKTYIAHDQIPLLKVKYWRIFIWRLNEEKRLNSCYKLLFWTIISSTLMISKTCICFNFFFVKLSEQTCGAKLRTIICIPLNLSR